MNKCTFCTFFRCFHRLDSTSHCSGVLTITLPYKKKSCRQILYTCLAFRSVSKYSETRWRLEWTISVNKWLYFVTENLDSVLLSSELRSSWTLSSKTKKIGFFTGDSKQRQLIANMYKIPCLTLNTDKHFQLLFSGVKDTQSKKLSPLLNVYMR